MSILNLTVDTITRKLLDNNQAPVFVINDVNVNKIRFGIQNGFPDIDVSENTAFRVMYIPPGTNKTVQSKTLSFYTNNGFYSYYDWDMESTVFQSSGILTVALCIFKNGTEVQGWHTVPYQIFVAGSIHTDDGDSSDETITPTAIERISILESAVDRLKNVSSGVPQAVGDISDMTDTDKIYVLSTDGKWYWYDGSAWVAGGTYGAAGTDTTLTQPSVPADAKAVGDRINMVSSDIEEIRDDLDNLDITGAPVADGEIMKRIAVSKYEDFKLIDGYGYFDAKLLINSICGPQPYSSDGYLNYVFRMNPGSSNKSVFLPAGYNTIGELSRIFSPVLQLKEVSWPGDPKYIGGTQEGFFVSKDPSPIRTSIYITVPKYLYGESASFGDFLFNLMDTVGILMDSENIIEYDPSAAITEATFGTISEATVEDELFYKGQININLLTDVIGITDTIANRIRVFSSFGFIDTSNNYTTYAKEFINVPAGVNQSRFYYTVKASGVGTKTVEAIKEYLVNVRHLKLYYKPEVTE